MENLSYSKQDEDTILHRLKSSLEHIWSVRKKSIHSPNRLEIQMSSSYILKDRSLDYPSPLTVIPELHEEHVTQSDLSKSCSKFSTKIEFIKPKQRTSEDSPTSVKSNSSDQYESPSLKTLQTFEPVIILEKPKPTITEEKPVIIEEKPKSVRIEEKPKPVKIEEKPKQLIIEEKPKIVKVEMKPSQVKIEEKPKPVVFEENSNKPDTTKSELIKKAKQEIFELRKSKENLRTKIQDLETSLGRLEEFKQERETVISIESKLQKLEKQQLNPEGDSRLPEAILKVKHLESEIQKLKRLKDSSVLQYEEELKNINHKLKDLQECNEILTEILACFKKEPLLTEKNVQEEPNSPPPPKELLDTIKLDDLINSESAIEEAYSKRDELNKVKEKLEAEYREIPSVSKSLSNKRRKLSLEYELSINYSQLVAINNKIKRFTSERN